METKKTLILVAIVFGMLFISCESADINEEILELKNLETEVEEKKETTELENQNKSNLQKVVDVRGMG